MSWGSLGTCSCTCRSTSAGDFFARFGGSPWHTDSSEAVLLDLYTSSSVNSSNKVSRGRLSQRMKSFGDILRQNCGFFCHILNLTTKQIGLRETVFKLPIHKSCGSTGGKIAYLDQDTGYRHHMCPMNNVSRPCFLFL